MPPEIPVVTREQVLRYRWHRTGLDAAADSVGVADLDALDLGVQDGANAAGAIGLVNRGVAPRDAIAATSAFGDDLALAWSVRGAPHYVRRVDLPGAQLAVSPFSERDAAKRTLLAGKTFAQAGIPALEGMRATAKAMRDAVPRGGATVAKGELSAMLTDVLPRPFLVDCRPCGATHPHEQLFRLCALHAGIEHEPGTNPPRLRRAPDWPRRAPGPADPAEAPEQLRVVHAYAHLLGPAQPRDVAAYLETTVGEVKANWPHDVREVEIDGSRASVPAADLDALVAASEPNDGAPALRLLSGFDLVLAAKDRERLVQDPARRKQVWPVLGRPDVVAIDGEPIGVWRPRSRGPALTLTVELWAGVPGGASGASLAGVRFTDAVGEQAERVAEARGQRLAALDLA
ncbi:MAG: DNA glycosylase AlkZ-like family protein [Pseudoclavibacter sp.]